MSKYRQYSDYRLSTEDWLGSYPSHWQDTKLKYILEISNGNSLNDKQKEAFEEEQGNSLSYISSKDIDVNTQKITYQSGLYIPKERLDEYKIASKNSTLLCIEGGSAGRKVAFTNRNVCFVNKLACLSATEEPKYIYYLVQSKVFKEQFYLSMTGLIGGVSISAIKNFKFCIPSKEERHKISEFLDYEIAKIDLLIEKQQKLLKLLAEKCQAAIRNSVTKGLNSSVPVKNSGIGCSTEVPEHWRRKSIKRMFKSVKRQDNEKLEVLSVYRDFGVVKKSSRNDNNNKTPEDLSKYQLVNKGDLVINKMKSWQGSLGVSEYLGITSPDYMVYAPTHKENPRFLHYLLRSQGMPDVYRSISNGIRPSQWRLEPEKFEQLEVFLPPRDEQDTIVEYIVRQLTVIEDLISKSENSIELMQERRTALISAVVTGKIDVRDWKPTEIKNIEVPA